MAGGTLVKNPMRRATFYGSDKVKCKMCGQPYTSMGISRHWAYCPKRPRKEDTMASKSETEETGYVVPEVMLRQVSAIQRQLELQNENLGMEIGGTPSGPMRNYLTNANLLVMQARENLDEALKVARGQNGTFQESKVAWIRRTKQETADD